jgi:NADH:ubiquinone reductase (H+-translocating)
VVVIGSGFGGLFATRALRRVPVEITLVARTTHHLFQPLLYQVATGILAAGEIAPATRHVLRHQRNARVLLGEVTGIDLEAHTLTSVAPNRTVTIPYDSLIVAAGAAQSYFGNDGFAEHAPGMKTIDDALEMRGRIFDAFELAELETDPSTVQRWLTFVVVGAGPTGVEMAGQIAELAHRTLKGNFRNIDPARSRVVLLDAAPSVLTSFGERLSGKATRQLADIGVEVRLNTKVVGVDATGIDIVDAASQPHRIESMCKMWAAGVSASPLGSELAAASGARVDRVGRVEVNPDCTLPGHPDVFVVGDLMALDDLPGVAQVAIQSGEHAAGQIVRRLRGEEAGLPFRYKDKGSMATVSRFHAVASVGRLRLAGFPAWIMWLAVHLLYLVGFKNRLTTVLHWTHSFAGRGRAERVTTSQQVLARSALERSRQS